MQKTELPPFLGRLAAVESSVGRVDIALFEDGQPVATVEQEGPPGEGLFAALESLAQKVGWAPRQIARWAVGLGPGSFTGIRIGLASVKGIALATGAEGVGVCALDTIAHGVPVSDRPCFSFLSIVPGELFVQGMCAGELILAPTAAALVQLSEMLAPWRESPCDLVGEAACLAQVRSLFVGPVYLWDGPTHACPSAVSLGHVACVRAAGPLDPLAPMYLRPPSISVPVKRALS